jgi:hypothetical protein
MRAFEREPNESSKAYAGFCAYRDLPPNERSIDAAYRLYSGGKNEGRNGLKRAPGYFREWSKHHDWVMRARVFDDWREMIRREAVEKHDRQAELDREQRRDRLRDRQLALAEQAADQLAQMLKWPIQERTVEQVDEQGRPVQVTLKPARWDKNTVVRFHSLLLQAIGDPKRVDVDVRELGINFEELDDLSLERIMRGEDAKKVWLEYLDSRTPND